MVLFNRKFYTILFIYVFLFGSLSAAYSGFAGIAVDRAKGESDDFKIEVALDNSADSLAESTETNIIPKVYAVEPVEEFVLVIPSIELEKEVVGNVDPRNPEAYMPVLNINIAHGKFTRMPDGAVNDGNVYLFAHREWTYEGKDAGFFARIGELGSEDKATIKYNGMNYTYKFRSRKVVDVNDVSVYTSEAVSPTLTLQTCDGNEKRLMIWFDLVAVD